MSFGHYHDWEEGGRAPALTARPIVHIPLPLLYILLCLKRRISRPLVAFDWSNERWLYSSFKFHFIPMYLLFLTTYSWGIMCFATEKDNKANSTNAVPPRSGCGPQRSENWCKNMCSTSDFLARLDGIEPRANGDDEITVNALSVHRYENGPISQKPGARRKKNLRSH